MMKSFLANMNLPTIPYPAILIWQWWWEQMTQLRPQAFNKYKILQSTPTLTILPAMDVSTVLLQSPDKVNLEFTAENALLLTKVLPAAVEWQPNIHIDQIIDEMVLFSPETCYIGFNIIGHQEQAQTVTISVAVIKRAIVDEWVEALTSHNVSIGSIVIRGNLTRHKLRADWRRPWHQKKRLQQVLIACGVVLLTIALAGNFYHHRQVVIDDMKAATPALLEAIEKVDQLNSDIQHQRLIMETLDPHIGNPPIIHRLITLHQKTALDKWITTLNIEASNMDINP